MSASSRQRSASSGMSSFRFSATSEKEIAFAERTTRMSESCRASFKRSSSLLAPSPFPIPLPRSASENASSSSVRPARDGSSSSSIIPRGVFTSGGTSAPSLSASFCRRRLPDCAVGTTTSRWASDLSPEGSTRTRPASESTIVSIGFFIQTLRMPGGHSPFQSRGACEAP